MTTAPRPVIEAIELHRLEVPLVRPFETSFGRETAREVLLVHVRTDRGDGWGECVADATRSTRRVRRRRGIRHRALPRARTAAGPGAAPRRRRRPRVGRAHRGSRALRRDLGRRPRAARRGPRAQAAAGGAAASIASVPLAASVAPALAFVAGHRMAKGALEAAVLDAELRAQGRSMGECFGAAREWVDCGVSVGIAPTLEELLDEVTGYVEEGYRRIKLKIKPGWDLVPVAAVRELLGRDAMLQVDANTAYTADDIPLLAGLDAFDLLLIEQPFAEEDLATHVRLAKASTPPVCLDESILGARPRSMDRARRDLHREHQAGPHGRLPRGAACARRVPRPRGAGLVRRHARDRRRARGQRRARGAARVRAARRHLGVARYFAEDLTEPFVLGTGEHRGQLRVPDGAGTGVSVRDELVRDWASSAPVTITAG